MEEKEQPEQDNANTKKKIEVVQEYVFLYVDGKVKKQKVKTGIQDNTYIQILEGVSEKQEVVVYPYKAISKLLRDSSKVKKVDKKELFNTD